MARRETGGGAPGCSCSILKRGKAQQNQTKLMAGWRTMDTDAKPGLLELRFQSFPLRHIPHLTGGNGANISSTRYYPHDQCPASVQNHRCETLGTKGTSTCTSWILLVFVSILAPQLLKIRLQVEIARVVAIPCASMCHVLTQDDSGHGGENQGCIP